ncbi:MAG TPA: cyclopropane-fatty-acyl-phospholipid synthase family protein [Vicinamibacterales bacterium]|jgi:cyclopropane-fatty-acyl-phospholipid synthase
MSSHAAAAPIPHTLRQPDRQAVQSTSPTFVVQTDVGRRWTVGGGPAEFVIRVSDEAAWQRLSNAGPYEAAKSFVDGRFDIDGDMLAAARWWYGRSRAHDFSMFDKLKAWLRAAPRFQTLQHARRNIEFHYDRSNEFYQQFLDQQMVYSSAYFADSSVSLDGAQTAKLDYVVRKLDLQPNERFLDVGCGWGALVIHAAWHRYATAVGCTLSARQFNYASRAVRELGMAGRATIELRDYRTQTGRFEKIASIGMYEHVGRRRLGEYFGSLAKLLMPDGLLLNSGIARSETVHDDGATEFLQRFVFPGGEIPYLTQVIRAAENAGFEVLDIENMRRHYAMTCARWVKRLQERRQACLSLIDATTYRTWLLYLAGSAVSFDLGQSELYQILFGKRSDSAPRRLTRRYMYT